MPSRAVFPRRGQHLYRLRTGLDHRHAVGDRCHKLHRVRCWKVQHCLDGGMHWLCSGRVPEQHGTDRVHCMPRWLNHGHADRDWRHRLHRLHRWAVQLNLYCRMCSLSGRCSDQYAGVRWRTILHGLCCWAVQLDLHCRMCSLSGRSSDQHAGVCWGSKLHGVRGWPVQQRVYQCVCGLQCRVDDEHAE